MSASIVLPILLLNEYHRTLTHECIKRMRERTDRPFELVIVETGSREFEKLADKHVYRPERTCLNHDMIAGLAACSSTSELVGHTGNDILVDEGWLEALWEPWDRDDCGASTLASSELGHRRMDRIEEGIYGPIMLFEPEWSYDPDYPDIFADTDLIMRIYRSGKRMFRNYNSVVRHLNQVTYSLAYSTQERAEKWAQAKSLFRAKHGSCGLAIYRDLVGEPRLA